jgi:hypothetical protein
MAIGGGVDYRVSHRFSIRPLQVDYLLTRFNELGTGTQNQNNLRVSIFRRHSSLVIPHSDRHSERSKESLVVLLVLSSISVARCRRKGPCGWYGPIAPSAPRKPTTPLTICRAELGLTRAYK